MKLTFEEIMNEIEASLKRIDFLIEGVEEVKNPDMQSFRLEARHEAERIKQLCEML